MRGAVRDGYIRKTPCVDIRLPLTTKTVVRLLAPEQIVALAGVMPARYSLLVLLGAAAGLRQGEAFGLACDRVDPASGMITIDQQVIIVDRRPVLADPKTFSSLRGVPMPAFLLRAVTGHCGQFALTGNDVLCRTGRGTLLRRDTSTGRSGSQRSPRRSSPRTPPSMTFGTRSPAPLWPRACRSPRCHVGSATSPSPRPWTCTGTWSRRPVAAPGMRWTRHSPERACVPPMCPRMLPSSAEMQVRDVGGGRAGL